MRHVILAVMVLIGAALATEAQARTHSSSWYYRGPASGMPRVLVNGSITSFNNNSRTWIQPMNAMAQYYPYGNPGSNVTYGNQNADVNAPIREVRPQVIDNPYFTGPMPKLPPVPRNADYYPVPIAQ